MDAIPGVAGVTFASSLPLRGQGVRVEVEEAADAVGPTSSQAASHRVDLEYFETFGVSLLAGRRFDRSDVGDGATAAIVNRSFVDQYLVGGDVLGRRFREVVEAETELDGSELWFEVVGVVEDMLIPSRGGRPLPATYHPIVLGSEPLHLAAHTRGIGPTSIVSRIREIAANIAPSHEVTVSPMDAFYRVDRGALRFVVLLVGLVTLSVLLLSAAGISAMMSFAVTRRQREIGIRTALGASSRQVITAILSRSTRQLAGGLLIGAAGAALLDRLTGGAMLGGQVAALLALVAAIMLFSGLFATLGPARRALRIQPMEALREE